MMLRSVFLQGPPPALPLALALVRGLYEPSMQPLTCGSFSLYTGSQDFLQARCAEKCPAATCEWRWLPWGNILCLKLPFCGAGLVWLAALSAGFLHNVHFV